MSDKQQLLLLQRRIRAIQRQLAQLGPMRPGCLTLQYRKPRTRQGPYHQLSYTHRMESRTHAIPTAYVPQIQEELDQYKRFRQLAQEWIDLSIERSRLKLQQWKQSPVALDQ